MRPPTYSLLLPPALAALLLVACSDERDTVERVIHQVADAAELKNMDGVMAYVSSDYRDGRGRDRERIRHLVAAQLHRDERISIAFRRVEVDAIDGGVVTASLEAVLAEGDIEGERIADVLPKSMGAWRFDLELRKEGERWLVTRGEERPLPPAAFLLGGR